MDLLVHLTTQLHVYGFVLLELQHPFLRALSHSHLNCIPLSIGSAASPGHLLYQAVGWHVYRGASQAQLHYEPLRADVVALVVQKQVDEALHHSLF